MPDDPRTEPLETPRAWHLAALAFAMLLPSVTTGLYFVLLSGRPSMQVVYAASKVFQFALPVAWVCLVQRRPIRLTWPPRGADIVLGLTVGGVMTAVGLLAYYGWFKHSPWLAETPDLIRRKLVDMRLVPDASPGSSRLGSPFLYFAFGLFVMAPHAGLEEYYWRWFVFGQLRRVAPRGWAIALSSLAFMAHHVIVLDRFLQGQWQATLLFSLCVAAGGAVWAWMYDHRVTLYAPWVSHMLVDAGIFYIGYDLVWRGT